jgi:hypothetical protein
MQASRCEPAPATPYQAFQYLYRSSKARGPAHGLREVFVPEPHGVDGLGWDRADDIVEPMSEYAEWLTAGAAP